MFIIFTKSSFLSTQNSSQTLSGSLHSPQFWIQK